MKKRLLCISACLIIMMASVQAKAGDSLLKAYNEISQLFNSGFYPATVSKADDFIAEYGQSAYLDSVTVMKGRSLFLLGRHAEADDALSAVSARNAEGAYWLGRCRFVRGLHLQALTAFHQAAVLFGSAPEDSETYRSTLVYSAFCLTELDDDEQAVSVLEYAFSRLHMEKDLQPSAALLFSLYQKTGNMKGTVSLYSQLEQVIPLFPVDLNEAVRLSAAGAYAGLGNTDAAWSLYSGLVTDARQIVMLEALQGAYTLSLNDPRFDVSVLLDAAEEKLATYPLYRAEMWLRLGIASFEQQDYERAEQLFDRAAVSASYEQDNLAAMYRSEMYLKQGDPQKGFDLLDSSTNTGSCWYVASLIQLARCAAYAGNSRVSAVYVQKAQFAIADEDPLNADVVFWRLWTAAQNGSWSTVLNMYEKFGSEQLYSEAAALYGEALMIMEPSAASAVQAARSLEASGDARNACVALLHAEDYERVISLTEDCADSEDMMYMRGLALLATGRWTEAAATLGTENPWALYYTACAEYRCAELEKAYAHFARFVAENPVHVMRYDAELFASQCALLIGKTEEALKAAANAYSLASTEPRRIESALQYAAICQDLERRDDAITMLEKEAGSVSMLAVPLKYRLADLYAAAGRLDEADELLVKTAGLLTGAAAEETLYRRGEIFFAAGLWKEAAVRFSACRKAYPDGESAVSALYYNALSLERGGEVDAAILLYEACRSADTTYRFHFSCMNQLVLLYRQRGEVYTALALAQQTVAEYPKESATSGLEAMLPELRLLTEGADEKTARLLVRYTDEGGAATPEGRAVGTELAQLYLDAFSKRGQGVELLKEIIAAVPEEPDAGDCQAAALALRLLGKYYRQSDELSKASDSYLAAAEYSASVSAEDTAHALYCAVEAFDAAGKAGNADGVFAGMKEMYDSSEWTARAARLLGK